MKRFLRRAKRYLALPQMRMFWFFLAVLVLLAVVNVIFLPSGLALSLVGGFILLAVILFIVNLRLARTSYEVGLERNQIRAIVGDLGDAVIAYDPEFTVVLFNKAAERLFDISAEEVVGKTFTPERIREERFRILVQVLFPALAPTVHRLTPSDVYPRESRLIFEDPKMELKVLSSKIEDDHGKLYGFFKAIHDETRERALLRSKSEFITVAAHQLRTPLSAINWIFQGFAKGSFGEIPEGLREPVDTGYKAAQKLSKTVDDLLNVSRIEEGRFGYAFEPADIVDLVQKVLEPYMGIAHEHNVQLYFDNKIGALGNITIDSVKISTALQILLDNALKYNVENGQITVILERSENEPFVRIGVKDTGIGIPENEMEKLFTKFFRAQNVLKYETEGTGLGLYIAKNIIERHGGKIWAESVEGRGTTFFFTIPTDESLIPKREMALEEFA